MIIKNQEYNRPSVYIVCVVLFVFSFWVTSNIVESIGPKIVRLIFPLKALIFAVTMAIVRYYNSKEKDDETRRPEEWSFEKITWNWAYSGITFGVLWELGLAMFTSKYSF